MARGRRGQKSDKGPKGAGGRQTPQLQDNYNILLLCNKQMRTVTKPSLTISAKKSQIQRVPFWELWDETYFSEGLNVCRQPVPEWMEQFKSGSHFICAL